MWLIFNDLDGAEAVDGRKRLSSLLKDSISRSLVSKGLTQSRLPRKYCSPPSVAFIGMI
jgi:hypothetical protein